MVFDFIFMFLKAGLIMAFFMHLLGTLYPSERFIMAYDGNSVFRRTNGC